MICSGELILVNNSLFDMKEEDRIEELVDWSKVKEGSSS